MTLRVPYTDFADAAMRFNAKEAYLISREGQCEITAAISGSERILFSRTEMPIAKVREELAAKGLELFDGEWSLAPPDECRADPAPELYVAAVSYLSDEPMPGIWVDAYAFQPSQMQVLRAIYEEFRETGEVGEIPFEEFVRLASPNVVIVSPSEIEGFAVTKTEVQPADR